MGQRRLTVAVGTRWLGSDGRLVDSERDALAFVFRWPPTPRLRRQVELAMEREAGGAEELARMDADIAVLTRELLSSLGDEAMALVEDQALTDAERTAAVQQILAGVSSPLAHRLNRARMHRDMLDVIATWNTLAVDVPPGWEDLGDVELEAEVYAAVVDSFRHDDRGLAEGNGSASGG